MLMTGRAPSVAAGEGAVRVHARVDGDVALIELRAESPAEAHLVRRIAAAQGGLAAGVEEYDKSILFRLRRDQIAHPQEQSR